MIKRITFKEGTEEDIPKDAKRVTATQLRDLKKVFQNHHTESRPMRATSKKGVVPTLRRPRCHIITCYVSADDGVTCWYHCVPK